MLREVCLARHAWELLKPLEVNADTINVERHLPTQFQLAPPKSETGILFNSGFLISGASSRVPEIEPVSPQQIRSNFHGSSSEDRSRSVTYSLVTPGPNSPGFRQAHTPRTEFSSDNLTSSDGATQMDSQKTPEPPNTTILPKSTPSFFSPESIGASQVYQNPYVDRSTSSVSVPVQVTRSRTVPTLSPPPEKGKMSWRSKLTRSRKETYKASGDTSSLSSTTLESQRLEEISLKSLVTASKSTVRGKNSKNINVSLSQNSTHGIFWTQPSIHILDVGNSPPSIIRAISTESTCVLAAITKVHLAYIIGTRDQKLTVRVFFIISFINLQILTMFESASNLESCPTNSTSCRLPHVIITVV